MNNKTGREMERRDNEREKKAKRQRSLFKGWQGILNEGADLLRETKSSGFYFVHKFYDSMISWIKTG